MHECNAMHILETKKKKQKTKNNGHKEQSIEAQGPCQKDSIRLSLLHSNLFRCTTSIGVFIHMGMISNSRIGIKVQSPYQINNQYNMILFLRHRYFWFVYSLSSLQLVTVQTNVSRLSTKVTNPSRLIMCLTLRKVRRLRFRLMKLIFLRGVTSTDLASLIEGLTTSLTRGSEEEEGTKFVEWGADTEMLSTKPNLVLSEGDF